uniref:Uncharacterized protein n=1 Tax=Leersia perrieri TaxID=77586 RepID=A0A0D9WPG4_9ORYZ
MHMQYFDMFFNVSSVTHVRSEADGNTPCGHPCLPCRFLAITNGACPHYKVLPLEQ